jgi:hypothetical protein
VRRTCDVFISHSIADQALAKQVADSVEAAGLTAFRADTVLRSRQDVSNAIWEALAESRAVIVIFSPRPVPDAMGLVEIGAAAAWGQTGIRTGQRSLGHRTTVVVGGHAIGVRTAR